MSSRRMLFALLVLVIAGTIGVALVHESSPVHPIYPPSSPTSTSTPTTTTPKPTLIPVTPAMEVRSITIHQSSSTGLGLVTTMRNNGPGEGEVSGACNWTCPVVIKQVSGFLSTEAGELIEAGQEKVLTPGGGVVTMCDGNRFPVPMKCSFTVQAFPKAGSVLRTITYEQIVTPP